MDVDDLLVEQVTLEEEIAFIVREGRGIGGIAKLHGAPAGKLEMGNRNQRVSVAAFGRGQLDDDAVDMSGVDQRGDGKLPHMAEGAAVGVDYWRPDEGRHARRLLIGMLCHRSAAVLYPTLPTTPHVSPSCRQSVQTGPDLRNTTPEMTGKWQGNLDIQEFHKHTAINTVI
jgi:hypothetical protein